MAYRITVERNDREIHMLYWQGSLEETIRLAREIGIKCEADGFRVTELTGCGAEAHSEEAPFRREQQHFPREAASGHRCH